MVLGTCKLTPQLHVLSSPQVFTSSLQRANFDSENEYMKSKDMMECIKLFDSRVEEGPILYIVTTRNRYGFKAMNIFDELEEAKKFALGVIKKFKMEECGHER